MKPLTFKKNSWHFYLANRVASYNPAWIDEHGHHRGYDKADICTYTKHVVGAMLLLFLAAVAIATMGTLAWHTIFGIIFSIITGMFLFTELGIVGLALSGIAAAFVGAYYFVEYLKRRGRRIEDAKHAGTYVEKPDGFAKHAYRSWKERFCMQINFMEPNGEQRKSGNDWDGN